MDLLDAIDHAESELELTLEALADARALVATLESDAKRIRLELTGLRSYAQRRGLADQPVAPADDNIVPISSEVEVVAPSRVDLALMSRTEAVATVMGAAASPMDRASIHEHFVDGGRFDTMDEISLSLSGLKRAGRVEKLGRGLWQLVEAATGS